MNSPQSLQQTNPLSQFAAILVLTGCLLLASSPVVKAQVTVSWSGYDAQFMPASGSSNLANGSMIRMGTFDQSGPFNLSLIGTSAYSSFDAVDAFFTEISTLFSEEYSDEMGAFAEFELSVSTQNPGTPLYIWAFNSADPSTATEWGIVGGNGDPASQWSVPNSFPGAHAFDIGDEYREIIYGSDSGIESPLSRFDSTNIRLAAIPEPSALWLLALALGAFGWIQFRAIRSRHS